MRLFLLSTHIHLFYIQLENGVLLKAIQKARNEISLGRKRTIQYGRELVEATESVKRQKIETDNIEIELKQKETKLCNLNELLQGKEEHNQSLKALVEAKERERSRI